VYHSNRADLRMVVFSAPNLFQTDNILFTDMVKKWKLCQMWERMFIASIR